MQCSLLYLSVYTHGFAIPIMLDTGAMVICKLQISSKTASYCIDHDATNCDIAYRENDDCHISYLIRYADWWFYLYIILLYITSFESLNTGLWFLYVLRNYLRSSVRQGHIAKYRLWTYGQPCPWTTLCDTHLMSITEPGHITDIV